METLSSADTIETVMRSIVDEQLVPLAHDNPRDEL